MKLVDEKGKLFGKLNIIDLLVVLLLIVAVGLVMVKIRGNDSAGTVGTTVLTYTVKVERVDPQVYEGVRDYIPSDGTGDQLMADGSLVNAWVVAVEATPHTGGLTMTDTSGNKLTFPVEEDKLDLVFTIKANVVNIITNEVGTQEVRTGKSHIVKTVHFELTNGIITSCKWEQPEEG